MVRLTDISLSCFHVSLNRRIDPHHSEVFMGYNVHSNGSQCRNVCKLGFSVSKNELYTENHEMLERWDESDIAD